METLKAQNRALGKLIGNKSEKIASGSSKMEDARVADDVPDVTGTVEKPEEKPVEKPRFNPGDRGNNHAKRKEFFDMVIERSRNIETVIEDVYPDNPAFDREKSKVIGYTDSILNKYIPGKFIKHIFRQSILHLQRTQRIPYEFLSSFRYKHSHCQTNKTG